MNRFINKISSRKFWIAFAGVATGVAMTLGISESEITSVAGVVLTIITAGTYIVTEGKIDVERVKGGEADGC